MDILIMMAVMMIGTPVAALVLLDIITTEIREIRIRRLIKRMLAE